MREFFVIINEYPWTSFFVGIFIIACISVLGTVIGEIRK